MHDQPEPTEEEEDQPRERQQEEDAMRQAGHDDPERAAEPGADE
jgi:hypothetical protein